MNDAAALAARVELVRDRIAVAAARAGRDPARVRLVAATKTVPAELIAVALAAGVTDVGENRAQELVAKAPLLAQCSPTWHFLGRLQRNKVRALAPLVALWQSVDRLSLGEEIARRAPGARVLVEVNVGDEPQKGGCAPGEISSLVEALVGMGLRVEGLMAVPPFEADPRPHFRWLRAEAERLGLPEVSMGMTDDFEPAVEEGSTMVRVGRAIFGERTG